MHFVYGLLTVWQWNVALLRRQPHNLNSTNAMKCRRSHRMYFYFQNIFIQHEKPLCFEEKIMKTSFAHGAGKLGSLGSLPLRKQSLRKLLSICKIACVSTINADTPQTVIMHQASISKLRSAHTMGLVPGTSPCDKSQGLVASCELATSPCD